MTAADQPTNDKKPDKRPPRKKAYLLLTAIIVVLSLSGGGVMWQIVREWSQPPTAEAPSAAVVRALERRLPLLERRLSLLEGRVENLDEGKNAVVATVESSERWWLAEVERYLVEAGERLRNGADVKSALSALKSARSTLKGVDLQNAGSTMVDAVREIMDLEIQLLTEYENYAAMRARALIDKIFTHLERGVVSDEKPVKADGRAADRPAGDVWEGLADRFKRLVVFETQAVDELQQLDRGLIVHSLMLAKTAILSGDNRSYRDAMVNAMQSFERSKAFDQAIYADLQVLQAIDITPSPPPIGKALREIRLLAAETLP